MITTTPRTRLPRLVGASLAAGGLALALAACGTDDASGDGATTPAATPDGMTSPTPEAPTPTPTSDDAGTDPAALTDGSTLVDIATYASTWVVTTVEGAVTTLENPSTSEVPYTWVIEPAGAEGTSLVRSSATTDDPDMCLNLPGDDVVGLAECDPADPHQQLRVTALDRPEQVNVSNDNGYLVADQEGGLAVEPEPGSPASVFTLTARGPAAG
ncbi:hypothetical protein LFM56_11020 [Cellulomonas iranensis]|uniref:hypothetical protein n=1 Tax=Cellulomonas iranensis TaxID=76862 RepID=UPI001CF1F005|nr:hypothetical protein [Cellulomonas iranensis]UCN13450.1 hypothetical protein LFM56_11020 [Cellulomonas iranensis]